MSTRHQLRLEDAKEKLSCFSLHLENLVRSACNSVIGAEDILSAVSEIESLVSWAAGQPELASEYDVLTMKLQQLHRIRELLELKEILPTAYSSREINDDIQTEDTIDEASKYTDVSKDDDIETTNYVNFLTILPADEILLCSDSEVKIQNDPKNELISDEINYEKSEIIHETKPDFSSNEKNQHEHCLTVNDVTSAQPENYLTFSDVASEQHESNLKVNDVPRAEHDSCLKVNDETTLSTLIEKESSTIINNIDNSVLSVTDKKVQSENSFTGADLVSSTSLSNTNAESDKAHVQTETVIDVAPISPTSASHINTKSENGIVHNESSYMISGIIPAAFTENSHISTGSEELTDDTTKCLENTLTGAECQHLSSQTGETPADASFFIQSDNAIEASKPDIPTDGNAENQNLVDCFQESAMKQNSCANNENINTVPTVFSPKKSNELDNDNQNCDEFESPLSISNEIVILKTDENDETERINNCKSPNDPLDVCMFAIKNLYESLKVKENELLKLSVIQNDQKQIEALQEVIIDFHREITNLNSQYEDTKKENTILKEQVLELEEAENDARLQAQKLEEKLLFLQEKDSHSQAEIFELKQNLEIAADALAQKETEERELRSELKYIEELVQKYEDQIKALEASNSKLHKQLQMEFEEVAAKKELTQKYGDVIKALESKNLELHEKFQLECEKVVEKKKLIEKYEEQIKTLETSNLELHKKFQVECEKNEALANKVNYSTKGTQTYDFSVLKPKIKSLEKSTEREKACLHLDHSVQVPESSNVVDTAVQTESSNPLSSLQNSTSRDPTEHTETPVQKQLLERLQLLVEEDVRLQQQLLYVDDINLALWKKLQSLESNIGECKKNLNELTPEEIERFLNVPTPNLLECNEKQKPNIPESKSLPEDKMLSEQSISIDHKESIHSSSEETSEREILDRLTKLEKINAAFEKELKTREYIFKQKEQIHEEWIKTEKQYIEELQKLKNERETSVKEISDLRTQKADLEKRLVEQQSSLKEVREKNRNEIERMEREHEMATMHMLEKVENLLTQEKEHLKMIANLKSERDKGEDKNELERLKYSYIELQIELSNARDDLKATEDKFKMRLNECMNKNRSHETKLATEIESLRNQIAKCGEIIVKLLSRQDELIETLNRKETELEIAKEKHKNMLEDAEEQYRTVELELKHQLREIEEGTALATATLVEERKKAEEELQRNVDDLSAKEEQYKVRISELEINVSHLREELDKVTGNLKTETPNKEDNSGESKIDAIEVAKETEKAAEKRNTEEKASDIKSLHIQQEDTKTSDIKRKGLLNELVEAEKREIDLKGKIKELEKMQKVSTEKIKNLEKNKEEIDSQLAEKSNRLIKVSNFLRESENTTGMHTEFPSSKSPEASSAMTVRTPVKLCEPQQQLTEKTKPVKLYTRTKMPEMKTQEETVATLREQVRELQSQLERISDEDPLEMGRPKTSPLTSRTVCKGIEDDFDYAEVEECLDVRTRPEGCSPAKHVYDLAERNIKYKYNEAVRRKEESAVRQEAEENDYDEVLPRPTNFHVVQQVGTDTLLVGWNYVNPSVLDGYEVYVGNQVHERIYTADRTKALISGLNLRKPIVLSICAVSCYGQTSEPTSLEYLPRSHSTYLENDYDEYYEYEESEGKRPYSMEW